MISTIIPQYRGLLISCNHPRYLGSVLSERLQPGEARQKSLRLMTTDFAGIYFPAPATAPRARCVAKERVSVQRDDALGRFGITERLTAIPNNNSVVIIVHGHSALTSNVHAWVELATPPPHPKSFPTSHFPPSPVAACRPNTLISR